MRKALYCCACFCACMGIAFTAYAGTGSISYSARVVHHNRGNLSLVTGEIDLGSGNFTEQVTTSFALDWKQVPSQVLPARVALPSIWQVNTESCQRFNGGLPRYNSPLLRHFLVGQVIGRQEELKKDEKYLSGQLVVLSADYSPTSFEIVASFNGAALVVVGRREQLDGHWLVHDLAVLGPSSELYQYFIEDITWSPDAPASAITLPKFNPDDYVQFPDGDKSAPVPICPVKNWLVFQAQLPGGRPLNLVFDSGADTMIVDDWVLKLDADLRPVGELPVAGAHEMTQMQQYEGFSFEVGGVRFQNLPVVGTQLTDLGYGADMRIHGVVGNEILQLCQLELDLDTGQLLLKPLGSMEPTEGLRLNLTFINELPHVQAELQGNDKAYLLVDTGQNSPLSVNLDYLDSKKMGDGLVMDGFTGDISGGLAPRYMVEQLGLNLGGQKYTEKTVDASAENTYSYDGIPVVGALGFPLFARHFAGITFDYSRAAIYLRGAVDDRTFTGSPEAWASPWRPENWFEAGSLEQQARQTGKHDQPANDAHAAAAASDKTTPADETSISDWADRIGQSNDPLDLVRATSPGSEQERADNGNGKRTMDEESLLLLLRDTADSVFATLQHACEETESAAPPAVPDEAAPSEASPAPAGGSDAGTTPPPAVVPEVSNPPRQAKTASRGQQH